VNQRVQRRTLATMVSLRGRLLMCAMCASTLGGCDSDPLGGDPDAHCSGKCDDPNAAQALVRVGDFEFCLVPPVHQDNTSSMQIPSPNLGNIEVLAELARLAYTEPAVLGPELHDLGFGSSQDAEWLVDCAEDVDELRAVLAEDPDVDAFDEASLSDCANDWAEDNEPDVDAFERFVHSTPHPERKLDFLSAQYDVAASDEFVRGSTQVFWAEHEREPWVVVSFRGTEFPDAKDLWTDANFGQVPARFGAVHGGFSEALDSVMPQLETRLEALPAGTEIWVTGHSLGGALASLFTAELLEHVDGGAHYRVAGMTTFGSPRVGNGDFVRRVKTLAGQQVVSLHRVANMSDSVVGFDPITEVPFSNTFGQDFDHVGVELELFEDGHIGYTDPAFNMGLELGGIPFLQDAIDRVREKVVEVLSEAFPHSLVQYRDRLTTAIGADDHDEYRRCSAR